MADLTATDDACAASPPKSDPSQAPVSPTEDAPNDPPTALVKGTKRQLTTDRTPRAKKQKVVHSHVCQVHPAPDTKPSASCFGRWSEIGLYKGARCGRPVTTVASDLLPVCSAHRAQELKMMRCQGPLSCGLACNEMVQWKPHGYRLCDEHWPLGKCFFLESLPLEVRLMIYRYLAPDQPVPARDDRLWEPLRKDRGPISTSLFRVCKTIRNEFASVFYGETTFKIAVENKLGGGPPLDMRFCLEKVPRQILSQAPQRPALQYDLAPWKPPLARSYFDRIRSLHIYIKLCIKAASNAGPTPAEILETEADRNLICDQLHQLVDCLSANKQLPLRTLTVSIRTHGDRSRDSPRAHARCREHCVKLLSPLRRLRSRSTTVDSFFMGSIMGEAKVYPETADDDDDEDSITAAVGMFCAETMAAGMPTTNPVLERFAQTAGILLQMDEHPYWKESDKEEMACLLNHARGAREKNDLQAVTSAFNDAIAMLKRLQSVHKAFMLQMQQNLAQMRMGGKSG